MAAGRNTGLREIFHGANYGAGSGYNDRYDSISEKGYSQCVSLRDLEIHPNNVHQSKSYQTFTVPTKQLASRDTNSYSKTFTDEITNLNQDLPEQPCELQVPDISQTSHSSSPSPLPLSINVSAPEDEASFASSQAEDSVSISIGSRLASPFLLRKPL